MFYSQNRLPRFLTIMVLLLISARLFACDLCGCFIGVLPYDNQSSISLQHRYRIFSGFEGNSGSVFPAGAYRLPSSNPAVLHGSHPGMVMHNPGDFESYKVFEIRGKWFIHPRWEVSAIVPYSDNKSLDLGEENHSGGLGDITLLTAWHLIKKMPDEKMRHRLVAGLGIKLPTGNFKQSTGDGDRIMLMMQPGSGSTDGIVYVAYTGGGSKFRWGLTATGKYSGKNSFHEQLSPSESATMFGGYILTKGQLNIIPQVQLFQEYLKGVYVNNTFDEMTGMNAMLAGPALSLFRKTMQADLGFQMPVYDLSNEMNLENKGRFFVSVTWNFNQTKYLLNSKNN